MAANLGSARAGSPQKKVGVLIDTNVIVDLLLRREPRVTQATPLWNAHDMGLIDSCVPASVLTDIFLYLSQASWYESRQGACAEVFESIHYSAG